MQAVACAPELRYTECDQNRTREQHQQSKRGIQRRIVPGLAEVAQHHGAYLVVVVPIGQRQGRKLGPSGLRHKKGGLVPCTFSSIERSAATGEVSIWSVTTLIPWTRYSSSIQLPTVRSVGKLLSACQILER